MITDLDARKVRYRLLFSNSSWDSIDRSYEGALRLAGATIHRFGTFGSYQGTWLAEVTFEGQRGFIEGSYGSCSGCDALEGEFGFSDDNSKIADFALFGYEYLNDMQSRKELVKRYSNEWDDSKEILDWLQQTEPR